MKAEYFDEDERMSGAVKHNGTVYLCGQLAESGEGDITAQTKETLQWAEHYLKMAGTSKENILSVTIYLPNGMDDFAAMNAVYDKWVSDIRKPARTCVQAQMINPKYLVEMTIIAAAGDE